MAENIVVFEIPYACPQSQPDHDLMLALATVFNREQEHLGTAALSEATPEEFSACLNPSPDSVVKHRIFVALKASALAEDASGVDPTTGAASKAPKLGVADDASRDRSTASNASANSNTAPVLPHEVRVRDVVGYASLMYWDQPEAKQGYLSVFTDVDYRRQGIGSALHEAAANRARTLGLSIVEGWVVAISDRITPPQREAAVHLPNGDSFPMVPELAATMSWGYELGNVEYMNALHFPMTEDAIAILTARAAEMPSNFQVYSWLDADYPPELADPAKFMESFLRLRSYANEEIPAGELSVENHSHTLASWEALVERDVRAGKQLLNAAICDESGQVVALSTAQRQARPEGVFHQDTTLVAPSARGQKLGWALKAALHKLIVSTCDQPRAILTWNAVSNKSMLHINESIGFHPFLLEGVVQLRL
ncbi:hypothetical protein BK816_07810 [Boudabousia tangfeifanii]|uniref:N-acetyltransferase domain-containing protein n=1 Tax=Boudabousia tangfeifanii TaxID=1912795 RepID=A0A1D9MLM7_9ACTO|nr:GNAT family N-acetyltransferase [Boudabousia tangfeifanii]AOZ73207.1 hypothetical protein BK816_07810 [Boudabousia tangfeifanii]